MRFVVNISEEDVKARKILEEIYSLIENKANELSPEWREKLDYRIEEVLIRARWLPGQFDTEMTNRIQEVIYMNMNEEEVTEADLRFNEVVIDEN
jgi:hypothetical protein